MSLQPHVPLRQQVRRGLARLGVAALVAISLVGAASGQAVTATGGPLNFGSSPLGTPTAAQTLTLQVPAGVTLAAETAYTNGNPSADYAITANTCNATAGPATCTVSVAFTPTARGLRVGALVVTQAAGGPSTSVPLAGVGQGAQLVFSPDTATATGTVTPLLPIYYSPSTLVYDGFGNLFFNDTQNARILKQAAGGTLSKLATLAAATPSSSMAIDGAGILYITSPSTGSVFTLPSTGGTPVALPIAAGQLLQPSGIAVDGNGNLYIADATRNTIVRANLDGSGAVTLAITGLAKPLSGPRGLAVDATNLYIVDSGNGRIVRVSLATLAATVVPLTGALPYNPSGIDVDSSGTIYVADTGNRRILRVLPTGASTAVPTPNFSFSAPTGILEADSGDLIAADDTDGLVRIQRSIPTTPLNFTTPTPVGNLDGADGTKFITLENIGNLPLQLAVPAGTVNNPNTTNPSFTVAASSSCPLVTSSTTTTTARIASAQSCTYGVQFTPNAVGTITGQLQIQSSPTGAGGPVTNLVSLSGTGSAAADGLQIAVNPNPVIAGQPATILVTVKVNGATSTTFRGTVTLASSDTGATFPSGTTYTFTAADAGSHAFNPGIVFSRAGQFTVTVTSGVLLSSTTVTVQPTLVTPAVSLSSSVNPVFVGNPTLLSATVSAPSGVLVPTGTVTFFNGLSAIGTATLDATGRATYSASFTSAGTDTITATYNGDATLRCSDVRRSRGNGR